MRIALALAVLALVCVSLQPGRSWADFYVSPQCPGAVVEAVVEEVRTPVTYKFNSGSATFSEMFFRVENVFAGTISDTFSIATTAIVEVIDETPRIVDAQETLPLLAVGQTVLIAVHPYRRPHASEPFVWDHLWIPLSDIYLVERAPGEPGKRLRIPTGIELAPPTEANVAAGPQIESAVQLSRATVLPYDSALRKMLSEHGERKREWDGRRGPSELPCQPWLAQVPRSQGN